MRHSGLLGLFFCVLAAAVSAQEAEVLARVGDPLPGVGSIQAVSPGFTFGGVKTNHRGDTLYSAVFDASSFTDRQVLILNQNIIERGRFFDYDINDRGDIAWISLIATERAVFLNGVPLVVESRPPPGVAQQLWNPRFVIDELKTVRVIDHRRVVIAGSLHLSDTQTGETDFISVLEVQPTGDVYEIVLASRGRLFRGREVMSPGRFNTDSRGRVLFTPILAGRHPLTTILARATISDSGTHIELLQAEAKGSFPFGNRHGDVVTTPFNQGSQRAFETFLNNASVRGAGHSHADFPGEEIQFLFGPSQVSDTGRVLWRARLTPSFTNAIFLDDWTLVRENVTLAQGQVIDSIRFPEGSVLEDAYVLSPKQDELFFNGTVGGLEAVFRLELPGAPFCFGETCPCGNDNVHAGCTNSTGQGAFLELVQGSASLAADDAELTVIGAPPLNIGFLLASDVIAPSPLATGDGNLCVGASFFKYTSQVIGENGVLEQAGLVAGAPVGLLQPGTTLAFQAYTRDAACGPPPAPCASPCSSNNNLSNAIRITFQP